MHPMIPFGSVKGSGHGMEFGVEGLKAVAVPPGHQQLSGEGRGSTGDRPSARSGREMGLPGLIRAVRRAAADRCLARCGLPRPARLVRCGFIGNVYQ